MVFSFVQRYLETWPVIMVDIPDEREYQRNFNTGLQKRQGHKSEGKNRSNPLSAIDADGCGSEFRRALASEAVNVGGHVPAAGVHLPEAAENVLRAGVVMLADKALQFLGLQPDLTPSLFCLL